MSTRTDVVEIDLSLVEELTKREVASLDEKHIRSLAYREAIAGASVRCVSGQVDRSQFDTSRVSNNGGLSVQGGLAGVDGRSHPCEGGLINKVGDGRCAPVQAPVPS